MCDKKQRELNCYMMTMRYIETQVSGKVRKYINSVFPLLNTNTPIIQDERPDFIIQDTNVSYAVETFLVDYCYDGPKNDQSQSKLANRELNKIYKKYHDDGVGTIKDSDVESAMSDIEDQITRLINLPLSFDYDKYVETFTDKFQKHYKNVEEYKKNNKITNGNIRLGFLIEFHRDTNQMHALLNGSLVRFDSAKKTFPITKEIKTLFENATNLDFIIVAQFNEGVSTEASDVKLYEPNNMSESIRKQRITVYDKIVYSDIRKNLSLSFEKS